MIFANSFFAYAEDVNIGSFVLFRNKMLLIANDENLMPIATFSVSCSLTETPLGALRINGQKMRWHTVYGDHNYVQYAVRIQDHILFHSVCYSKYGDPKSLKVDTYNDIIDMNESQGCIRMRTEDAEWVYNNVKPGTIILIVDTEADLMRPKYDYMIQDLNNDKEYTTMKIYNVNDGNNLNIINNMLNGLNVNQEENNDVSETGSKIIWHHVNN